MTRALAPGLLTDRRRWFLIAVVCRRTESVGERM